MSRIVLLFLFILTATLTRAQEKFEFSGYIKSMQTFIDPVENQILGDAIITDNLIHNRINLAYYPDMHWSFILEGRNRLMYGEMVKLMNNFSFEKNGYARMLNKDAGYFDLSESLFYDHGYIMHSMIDRLYADYVKGNWQVRLGRQRINWGINMVWNPNDIFNTFNYFDFDYEERPGTDALKVQYYTGAASSGELVYQVDENWEKSAIGGMYRFNKVGYDFQVLGGYVKSQAVLGLGWSGHIGGAGFRGEATAFQDDDKLDAPKPQLVAAVSADYMFSNSLFAGCGLIFNSEGKTGNANRPMLFQAEQQLSAQTLTPSRMETYLQLSYPVTPLLNADLTTIMNPYDGSWFAGPSVIYSLADNVEAMITSQLFFGDKQTEYGDIGQLYYLRLKWSF